MYLVSPTKKASKAHLKQTYQFFFFFLESKNNKYSTVVQFFSNMPTVVYICFY